MIKRRPMKRSNKTFATNHINKMIAPPAAPTAEDYRRLAMVLSSEPLRPVHRSHEADPVTF